MMLTVFPVLKIHYWERDKQNQTEKVKVIFVPDTRVRLVNLTSYTPYLVTLTAFNTAGDGPPSEPRGARTLQSGREKAWPVLGNVENVMLLILQTKTNQDQACYRSLF